MLSAKEVTNLYQSYGFEVGPCFDDYCVYFNQSGGYFQNAEIVVLNSSLHHDDIDKTEYERLGYSVRIKHAKDLNSLHEDLFSGFFNISYTKKMLDGEYRSFCKQQSEKLLSNDYSYISGDYFEDGGVHSSSIITRFLNLFSSNESQLIILEASAGYGKTCTSFEVMHCLAEEFKNKVVLMAELSKNRKASIFRYVLLSEINSKFSSLNAELVTREIQEGRVLLIIDGFDELLSKSYSNLDKPERNAAQDAQTMLDTIAQLFPADSKTKVLLTSRKSSMFAGQELDSWIDKHLNDCNITRLQLSTPSIKNWLDSEKQLLLKRNNIDLNNILNPVILSMLRSEPIETFSEKYKSINQIIEQYLHLLLSREKRRQDLQLSIQEQLSIMSNLAANMVQYDISAESVDFIKELLKDITAGEIKNYLSRYDFRPDSVESKPTEEEFLTKLSQHALLDRVSIRSSLIGFINEFIFGLMIGNALLSKQLSADELGEKYLDIATTAFSSCNHEKRQQMYDLIKDNLCSIIPQRQIVISMHLINSIGSTYSGCYFDGISFENGLCISAYHSFTDCVFSDCVFRNCKISPEAFFCCQFYNCLFYDNEIVCDAKEASNLIFLSCTGHENFAAAAATMLESKIDTQETNYKKTVLEQFWKHGYDKAEPRRAYNTLLKGVSAEKRPYLAEAIDVLVKEEILTKRLHSYELNFKKMDQILEILDKSKG